MFRFLLFSIFSILLFLMSSCDAQSVTNSNSSSSSVKIAKPENAIVYLFFEIEKEGNNLEKVTLTEKKISAGYVKNASIENKSSAPGNLQITMLGKNGDVLEERVIEDPLNPVLEVYAEEGLSQNKLSLKKAQFSVRFNQKGEISSVKVEKINANSKNTLITLTL